MIKKQYPANKPELKKKVKLQVSLVAGISVQVTISRVSISILKERPKSKIRLIQGPLCSRKPILFFFFFFLLYGPGRTVMCILYIYKSLQYLIESFTVRCTLLRTDIIGNQTITFFATHNYNPVFELLKRCGSCSGHEHAVHC